MLLSAELSAFERPAASARSIAVRTAAMAGAPLIARSALVLIGLISPFGYELKVLCLHLFKK